MHTSKILRPTDFTYCSMAGQKSCTADLQTFCPGYHILDRVGVVSPCLEDGIRHTGYALLALTTAFYDVLRASTRDFYDYPQHFAFLDASPTGVQTHAGRLRLDHAAMGAPWGGLDVWPDSNWVTAPGTASGMLKKVFDWQISRLFWPEPLHVAADEPRFPLHVRRLLATRLKTVYYYNTTAPTIAIGVTAAVEELVHKSLQRLPALVSPTYATRPALSCDGAATGGLPYVEGYRHVSVATFLETMADCFEPA
jgi:hypothetical protein